MRQIFKQILLEEESQWDLNPSPLIPIPSSPPLEPPLSEAEATDGWLSHSGKMLEVGVKTPSRSNLFWRLATSRMKSDFSMKAAKDAQVEDQGGMVTMAHCCHWSWCTGKSICLWSQGTQNQVETRPFFALIFPFCGTLHGHRAQNFLSSATCLVFFYSSILSSSLVWQVAPKSHYK